MRYLSKLGFLRLGGLLVLLIVVGLGCGKSSSNTVKISSWGDPKENAILTDLINDFEKIHPEIKVELQRVPWGEYNTKLLTEFAGGIAADVIFVSTDNVVSLVPRGVLEPLDDYIKGDTGFPLKDYYPSLIDRFTVNGHLYGVPRDTSPICVMYYNKKAFDAAKLPYPSDDWTWTQFIADAKALTKHDASGRTTQWGFMDDWANMVESWVYSAGGRWVDSPQHPNAYAFDTPAFISGLQMRADLMLKYKVMPTPAGITAMGGMGSSDMFVNGTTAIFLSGIWKTPQFRDIKDFDWDVVMAPKGPTGQRGFQGGGSGYGILSSSKNKKGAWELVKYIAGVQGQTKMGITGLAQPALQSVANSPVFLDGQKPLNKKMLLKAEPYGIFEPMALNWLEIRQGTISPLLDQIWSGKITPKEMVAQLAEALKNKPLVVKLATDK